MKIYISADIEGISGITHWDEAGIQGPDYGIFRAQMTAEVSAACEGALQAGAEEIWVKDAHASGRNLIPEKLPREVRLVRGWSGHPFKMVQEVDESFDAMLMVGYHSPAGSGANPLAHTITGSVASLKLNGQYASEFLLNTCAAALENVPVVFVSGDVGLCQEAQSLIPAITAVAVKQGIGDSTVSIHPQLAAEEIRDKVQMALEGEVSECRIRMPERFSVEIGYRNHAQAHRASFFPGAGLKDPHTIEFETDDYFEVLRLLLFVL